MLGSREDPATGSAASALSSYLSLQRKRAGRYKYYVTQGVEMGRPSTIEVAVRKEGGAVRKVSIGGQSVPVMRGTLLL